MLLENIDQYLYVDLVIELQVFYYGDQKIFYSCLIVDEGFDEIMIGFKVYLFIIVLIMIMEIFQYWKKIINK